MCGHAAAWHRVPWILQSNSVLLFIENDNVEWFYSAMKPWEHYVPIKDDLSDMLEKVQWLRDNDEEAQQIVKRA